MMTVETLRRDWALATEVHKLEARVWRECQRLGLQIVLVTSASRGEGKSTTVSYLATALGQYDNRRIVAVDLDLRVPRLAPALGLNVERGVEEVLRGHCALEDVLLPTELPGLSLVGPGEDADVSLLLRSSDLHHLFHELRQHADLALIDAPALNPVADTVMLLPMVDAVLLVAMAGLTTKQQLQRARELCRGMNTPIMGLVVGNLSEDSRAYEGQAGYYRANRDSGE
jgi:capsular exopolysaccharide synthesis family protein